jgi:hypothetical protein
MKKMFLVPALCLVAVAACNRDRVDVDRREGRVNVDTTPGSPNTPNVDRDRSGTTTVTGANVGSVGNESAIARIVAARCAREAACNNVGADKRFTSGDVCSQKLKNDMRDDLSAKDCPRGIDQKELNECLDEIKNENCNNPIDMIGRLAACRTSDLCLKTDAPNR